jgi:hypothetical protein
LLTSCCSSLKLRLQLSLKLLLDLLLKLRLLRGVWLFGGRCRSRSDGTSFGSNWCHSGWFGSGWFDSDGGWFDSDSGWFGSGCHSGWCRFDTDLVSYIAGCGWGHGWELKRSKKRKIKDTIEV